ncbi:MAG: polysaccharide biosynthesis/export family protein [Chlamydiales bacterium]|nr:polysaccharide biosynthesis/export family protein [Chlamydiales bacterium]
MAKIWRYFVSMLAVLATGCSGPYMGKDVFGADEFVLDSYKIREGKFSILELEGKEYEPLQETLLEPYKDVIGEDDVLQIALYHPKRSDIVQAVASIGQSVGYRVVGGAVSLPDLPPICVAGLTLEAARQAIQACYQTQIQDMEVFVAYKDRMVGKVELAGMVQISSVAVDGKIRLFDVLSKAKVPPEANLFKSYLAREGQLISVDFYKLLKEGDMTQNVVMRGGDKVYIAEPSAASLMVMGEVGRERVIHLPHGFMSLRHVLAEAGGILFTGDRSYIQVIRGNICQPKIYTLSWEHVIHLPNDSLLLMPGDIVYVASKPITEWNRFISQLLPSFTMGQQCVTWGVLP